MADTSMERTDIMNHDAIGDTIDDEEVFRVATDGVEEELAMEQDPSLQDQLVHSAGDDRLQAFAQHIVDASGHHLQPPDELTMEQTLEEQQHAADLLGLAGPTSANYEHVYSEGMSGLLEAQDRDRREEQNVDEHGYPIDQNLPGAHDDGLDGGIFNEAPVGDLDGIAEDPQDLYHAEEYAVPEKATRKRKRKDAAPDQDTAGKKSAHKEIERKRRANISAGVEGLAELLPTAHKHKGQILQRAAEYIRELLDREVLRDQQVAGEHRRKQHDGDDQWMLEKVRLEQENEELTRTVADLQNQLERAQTDLLLERAGNDEARLQAAWRDGPDMAVAMGSADASEPRGADGS